MTPKIAATPRRSAAKGPKDEADWAQMVDDAIAAGDEELTEEQRKVREHLVAQAMTQL